MVNLVHTQSMPYLSTVTIQHKTRQRCVRRIFISLKARKRVLFMVKAHKHVDLQARKTRINAGQGA